MKAKWRVAFIGAVVFVVYVSYKILEPELFRNNQQIRSWDKEPFEVVYDDVGGQEEDADDNDHHRNAFQVFGGGRDADSDKVKKEQVIQSMIERFSVNLSPSTQQSPWQLAESWVEPRQIHPENVPELGSLLYSMAYGKITGADFGQKGTQLKLTLMLENQQKVIFKPAWYSRDYMVTGKPYSGNDRHNAEIAAFHLGRLLELRRTPLAVGRRINVTQHIKPVATARLLETFFYTDGEPCFYGKCLYCKGPENGVCAGDGGIMEGTIVLYLPDHMKLKLHKHPWARTYRDGKLAKWETDNLYCDKVKQVAVFSEGQRLLDIIDTCVFDFLIGNGDRHHYETFEHYDDSILVILDNGKSFGNPELDELSILAPLYQCCQIRYSLWQRLLALQDGVLGRVLEGVLSHDPISPVLTQRHLQAMDRRLSIVLQHVQACIEKVGVDQAIVAVTS